MRMLKNKRGVLTFFDPILISFIILIYGIGIYFALKEEMKAVIVTRYELSREIQEMSIRSVSQIDYIRPISLKDEEHIIEKIFKLNYTTYPESFLERYYKELSDVRRMCNTPLYSSRPFCQYLNSFISSGVQKGYSQGKCVPQYGAFKGVICLK